MSDSYLVDTAHQYLWKLCVDIPNRCVGSQGNRQATKFFADKMIQFGFQTESPQFDCIDWTHGEASLYAQNKSYAAFVSPYSLKCNVTATLTIATTVEELESLKVENEILLLHGEIAKEQLMPKNFTFYNPEHHQRIISLLEKKAPSAIISATTRDPELAGGIYPFPLIEDGDFDIPSVYMTEEEGKNLARHNGEQVSLKFEAKRIPATGINVIARKGRDQSKRIVVFAHIDAKMGTPGALDNATGVVVLLLLAELLQDQTPAFTIELVALNGEDYYSAPGEVLYLKENPNHLQDVYLGINLDGAGYIEGETAYSLYDCPPDLTDQIHRAFHKPMEFIEGEQWHQSDHSLFIMNNRPALAITSEQFSYLSTYITHTKKDSPDLVEPTKLVEIALALQELLLALDSQSA
jgi:aminopeptidase YwaD